MTVGTVTARQLARTNLRRVIARAVEYLSATRGGALGRPPTADAAVDGYQQDLADAYEAWADDAARQLAAEKDDSKRAALLLALLALLLDRLTAIAHTDLLNAIIVGLDGNPAPPDLYTKLAELMAANDAYLANTLIPAIQDKLLTVLMDPDLLAAIYSGNISAAATLKGWLYLFAVRVAGMAGIWWQAFNWAVGMGAEEGDWQVKAFLDPQAHHCSECPLYHSNAGEDYISFANYLGATGGRVPGQFECLFNCRCTLRLGPKKKIYTAEGLQTA